MNLNVVQDVIRSKQSLEASDQEEERQMIPDGASESSDDESKSIDDDERAWGWWNCRPRTLQWLNTSRWMLSIVCLLTVFQGMAVYSFVQMSLPSLEKRFLLNSKQTGFIISSMDITSMIFGTLISFYGGHSHKGKWLGCGAIITGIASCLYTLPHFLSDSYDPTSVSLGRRPMCFINNTSIIKDISCPARSSSYYYIFVISQLFAGIGAAPMLTITPAWLDENVHPKHISLYLGIFFTSFVIGPSVGSLIGGKLLEIYVQLSQSPGVHITPRDQRWIGAWWLGPLCVGFILVFCGSLLLGFPSKLPGSRRMRREAIQNGYIKKKNTNIQGNLKDIIPATKLLFSNKTYIFHVSAMITGTFAWYGAGPFLFKLIVDRYGTPQFLAGMMMFVMSLVGGNIGLWIGSVVVSCLGLRDSCRKSAKFVFFVNIFTLSVLSFLVPGCIYPRYAGVDVPYANSTSSTGLVSACNRDCQCTTSKYMPVCGPGDINYFSPCYAGCPPQDPRKGYNNCSCVVYPDKPSVINTTSTTLNNGLCKKQCNYSYFFFGFLFVMTIIGVSDSIPSEIVMFRSVPDNQRSYALGIQFVLSKLMASVPGPIIIGYVIDETCSLWKTKPCGQRGNCLNYDYDKLGWIIVSYAIPLKALSLLLYFLSWYYCKDLDHVPEKKNTNTTHDHPGKCTAV